MKLKMNFLFNDDFYSSLKSLEKAYNQLQEENNELKEKLASYNKEAEIDKYKNELNYVYEHSLLQFSDEELQENKEFIAKHAKSCGNDCFVYSLTSTGIGTIIKIACSTCGETENITDISSW